jgi:hypothetical protein
MKTIILSLLIISLMIGAPLAYAETAYQSGFKHGVADAKLDNANMSRLDYVSQPGNGLDNHTPEFADGYVKGWCSIMGPNTGKEITDTVFDCERTDR